MNGKYHFLLAGSKICNSKHVFLKDSRAGQWIPQRSRPSIMRYEYENNKKSVDQVEPLALRRRLPIKKSTCTQIVPTEVPHILFLLCVHITYTHTRHLVISPGPQELWKALDGSQNGPNAKNIRSLKIRTFYVSNEFLLRIGNVHFF